MGIGSASLTRRAPRNYMSRCGFNQKGNSMSLILIIVVLLLLGGGGGYYGYNRGMYNGVGFGGGLAGLLVVLLVIYVLFGAGLHRGL